MRRTAGPPAPRSWLESSVHAPEHVKARKSTLRDGPEGLQYAPETRLDTLPGAEFPPALSLQDVVVKTMAKNWKWHLENDGIYLSELPTLLKERLLSYISKYSPITDQDARIGLRVFFPRPQDLEGYSDEPQDEHDEVTRLDLASLMYSWPSRGGLKKELLYTRKLRTNTVQRTSHTKRTSGAAESWEDTSSSSGEAEALEILPSVVQKVEPSFSMRFPNLVHLSLAQVSGTSSLVSWPDLLAIAPYLSTLNSLSIANWPVPAHVINDATPSSPRSLYSRNKVPPTYAGSRNPAADFEADWAEAGSILRKLSKDLYCLRWLDLSGCTSWTAALTPQRSTQSTDNLGGFDFTMSDQNLAESGPGWNESWRGITHIRFAVNWIPRALTTEGILAIDDWLKGEILRGKTLDKTDPEINGQSSILNDPPAPSRWAGLRVRDPEQVELSKWANSRLAQRTTLPPAGGAQRRDMVLQNWDVDHEREKYYQKKELEQYMRDLRAIRHVADQIRRLRLQGKGKFIDFDFGYADA